MCLCGRITSRCGVCRRRRWVLLPFDVGSEQGEMGVDGKWGMANGPKVLRLSMDIDNGHNQWTWSLSRQPSMAEMNLRYCRETAILKCD